MNNVALFTTENFPEVSYCEEVQRMGSRLTKSKLKPLEKWTVTRSWVTWFLEDNEQFEFLCVNLKRNEQLIFKKINSKMYLVIFNQKESLPMLLSFLKGIRHVVSPKNKLVPVRVPKKSNNKPKIPETDVKLKDAIRIQKLMIPNDSLIKEKFKNFFVVLQQQEGVGGDFYWYKEMDDNILLCLVDCTGHGIEGAMTSMLCNSLLNQAMGTYISGGLEKMTIQFYKLLEAYNLGRKDPLDYGVGAELGLYSFNYRKKEIRYVSTGISAFLRTTNGMHILKPRRILDYSKIGARLKEQSINMANVQAMYMFSDGLTDQFDKEDKRKLGRVGVLRMIEREAQFDSNYYKGEIQKWKGNNMQYDDITLLGVAI